MRKAMIFALAAALAATPGLAQNADVAENAVDANAANMTVPADNMTMTANDIAAAPAPAPVTTEGASPTAPAPAERSRGFPWGIIGLVGLIGLLGRKRRD